MSCLRTLSSSAAALALAACSTGAEPPSVGQVEVELSSRLGELDYHLQDAQLHIDGPDPQTLTLDGPGSLELTLPAGAHRLTLEDGWRLLQGEGPDAEVVAAQLLSDNPVNLFIGAGSTERLTFRFALDDGSEIESGTGQLDVGIDVSDDASVAMVQDLPGCVGGLRINELDYDQAGTDDAEFIEVLNTGRCDADLEGVILDFINGSDGEAYGGANLGEVGLLAAGARLVVGDAAVVALLPDDVAFLPLSAAGLQNGPDAVWLSRGEDVLDAVAYGEGGPMGEGDSAAEAKGEFSLSRCPDAFDTGDNSVDLVPTEPTPGEANFCA